MLSPKFKKAVLAEIQRARASGQSEGVAIADWLDGIYEEESMSRDLILSALSEFEDWAKAVRLTLLKGVCCKCGSDLNYLGLCKDATCPFSNRLQNDAYSEG